MTQSFEQIEDQLLAVYATFHSNNGGRLNTEADHIYRTGFQRDRDRILHSKAFRRLGYKTQVFVNSEGDNYRTRLTHSLEVSQIARSVAATLRLNRDLAETLALGHDLGHTPFGHAGQDMLHVLMKDHDGFEHNKQSLRIVSVLEERYPYWEGLNLTRSTLKGMMKHGQVYDCDIHLMPLCEERQNGFPALESILVDQCDRIAYVHHDLEDGLDSGYLHLDQLNRLEPWREAKERCSKKYGIVFDEARIPLRNRIMIRSMLDECISDLIETSIEKLQTLNLQSYDEVLNLKKEQNPIRNSAKMAKQIQDVYQFLHRNLYRHPDVVKMSRRGERIIEILFSEYVKRPEMMPWHVQRRIDKDGLYRVVSDYVAGMTDRFAAKQSSYFVHY
ncbi:MAG: deoxyguanosinetriphosphate triphosphohydrolase [Leptonema sp. (in: Bacteria)]|nr:deoxyguanosinetriphosphate triphosphohydrolase [Leptonema sp. (in: bacteria)]